MKALRPTIFFAITIAIGACSLNPQPFPPAPQDNGDDRGGGTLGLDGSADAGIKGDAQVPNDSGIDSGMDAALDAPSDAPIDGDPDADLDGGSSDAALSSD